MPSVTVIFPSVLRAKINNNASITVIGHTIREVIEELEQSAPGIQFNLCYETGELRPYVNIFLEKDNIRFLQGLDTPVPAGACIRILQSVAGG